jgi:hypothetical protein
MAAMEIRWQNRFITALEHDKNTQREFFIKQIEYLNRSIALGMANSSNLIKALDDVIQRPAVDPSISSAIERISLCLRENSYLNEKQIKEDLDTIARKNPSILREIYHICANTATGAAGNLIANWVQPFLNVLPH